MSTRLTVPGALVWKDEVPLITLGTVDADLMSAPFITDKLATMRVTRLESLDAIRAQDHGDDLGLAGGIFHMTRCGSTLLCHQFAALDRVSALSEPFAFQHLLEGPPAPPAVTRRRLRTLITLWRDALAPVADRFVIKWPLLMAHHSALIAEACPATPLLFLHRDPTEILASIQNDWLGGLRHIRPRHTGAGTLPDDPYRVFAAVIAAACGSVAKVERVRTLDYRLLPDAAATLAAPFFGLEGSSRMIEAARNDAKDQSRPFPGDSAAKQANLRPELRDLANMVIGPALATTLATLRPLSNDGQDVPIGG